MSEQEDLTPADAELAGALNRLRPAMAAIDRDEMMFRAGQRLARRQCRLWQGAAGLMTVLLAVSVAARLPAPQVAQPLPTPLRTVEPAPAVVAAGEARPRPVLGDAAYLRLQQAVLSEGLDALPAPQVSSTPPERYETWMQPFVPPRQAPPLRREPAGFWTFFLTGDGA
jgi:hypothetical protein